MLRPLAKHQLPALESVHQFSAAHLRIAEAGRTFDARDHAKHWRNRWVCFSDLQAFGAQSKLSDQVPLNNLLRFHHCLGEAAAHSAPLERFDFTDASYTTFLTLTDALRFASRLHLLALAHNAVTLSKAKAHFHKMIMPTTGVARGKALFLEPFAADAPGSALMLGSGIVRAYEVQSAAVMGTIAIAKGSKQAVRQLRLKKNSHLDAWKSALLSADPASPWVAQQALESQGAWLFPWLAAALGQGKEDWVVAAEPNERNHAFRAAHETIHAWLREFHVAVAAYTFPDSTAKHGLGFARWAFNCKRAIHGAKQRSTFEWARFLDGTSLT